MTENLKLALAIILLIGVYILTRKVHSWRIRRAFKQIVQDLQKKGAFDPESAVPLPYAKHGIFQVGVRDYKPKVLEYLVQVQMVGKTPGNRYFLKKDPHHLKFFHIDKPTV